MPLRWISQRSTEVLDFRVFFHVVTGHSQKGGFFCMFSIQLTDRDNEDFLIDIHDFYYVAQNDSYRKLKKFADPDGIEIIQTIDQIVALAGDHIVKFTSDGNTYAISRPTVKLVLRRNDGKATIYTKINDTFNTDEDFVDIAAKFVSREGTAIGSVLADGVTVVGNGSTVPLAVGVIDGGQVIVGTMPFDRIENFDPNKLLGSDGSGQIIEVDPGAGLTLAAGVLTAVIETMSNVGAGAGIFKQKTGDDFELRSIVGGDGISVAENADDVTISSDVSGENVGAGPIVIYAGVSGGNLQFKTLAPGAGIALQDTANVITIVNTGAVSSGLSFARKELTVPAAYVEACVVDQVGDGTVTFSRASADEIEITVPDGVDILGGTIHFTTTGNPGAELHLRIIWQGNGPDGNARPTGLYGKRMLKGVVFNRTAEDFAGPSRLVPATGTRMNGAVVLDTDWTDGAGLELETRFTNYNGVTAGGNNQTTFDFWF